MAWRIPEAGGAARLRPGSVLLWAFASVTFALAYGQMPLYDGNYNAYLLHGFARAGEGHIAGDALAATTDPFPLFSAIVMLFASAGAPALVLVGHGLLLAMYLCACVRLAEGAVGAPDGATSPLLVATLALPQVWLGRDAIAAVFAGDWGWYLQSGLAMQYAVGHTFQPSMFGVLCIASLAAFIHRRDRLAFALAAAAPLFHFSYFLAAIGLVAGFALERWRTGGGASGASGDRYGRMAALRPAAAAAALLALACGFALRFLPQSPETAAEATRILAEVRIPHHALPERFLGHPSVLRVQVPLLALGVAFAWRTRIRWPLLVALGLGAALLCVELVTRNRALALLFPWRVSTVLVPAAFVLVVARLGERLWLRAPRAIGTAVAVVLGLASAGYGLGHTFAENAAYARTPEVPMIRHVRTHAAATDLYVIPANMKRFRLEARARTFVDYKSHPYRDVEVIEWNRRVGLARSLEDADGEQACALARVLRDEWGASHFVRPSDRPLHCGALERVYEDASYAIWRWDGGAHPP